MKPMKLHDDFMEEVRIMVNEHSAAVRKGDVKGAAKIALKLANARVDYYEQFLDDDVLNGKYQRSYRDDYENALRYRANVRDQAFEVGVIEE